MKIDEYFGRFWYVSFLCIGILITYSSLLTVGTFYLSQNYNQNQIKNGNSGYVIQFSIISDKIDDELNKSFLRFATENTTLFSFINDTIGNENFGYIDYGVAGYFITRFYSVSSSPSWDWLFYYRTINTTSSDFIYSSIGVSHFKITNHLEIKFVFTEA